MIRADEVEGEVYKRRSGQIRSPWGPKINREEWECSACGEIRRSAG